MKSFAFDLPANYQICVQGRIDPNWSDRFEGMSISLANEGPGSPFTTLEGELHDQVALAGILNTLYELHLPVLLVMRLPPEIADESDTAILHKD
jgi:hypothetical protein